MLNFLFEKPVPPTFWVMVKQWLCGWENQQTASKANYIGCLVVIAIVLCMLLVWRRRRCEGRPTISINNTLSTGDCNRHHIVPSNSPRASTSKSESDSGNPPTQPADSDPKLANKVVRFTNQEEYTMLMKQLEKENAYNAELKGKMSVLEQKIKEVETKSVIHVHNSVQPPPMFDPKLDVEVWLQKFEIFLQATQAENKNSLLLTSVCDQCAKMIMASVSSNDKEEAYQEALQLMRRLYQKDKVSELESQRKFLERIQRLNENIFEYGASLRALARDAYPNLDLESINKYARSQFIRGLKNKKGIREIITQRNSGS